MYEKQTWNTGDVITEEKLNHMEDGISNAGGVMVVNANYDESTSISTLDKTWKEIYDCLSSGVPCYVKDVADERNVSLAQLLACAYNENASVFECHVWTSSIGQVYTTESESGFPYYGGGR